MANGESVSTRILIADDNPVVRECLSRLLRSHVDWEICGEAADGEDVVRQTRQLTPDVVILDFLMPRMNGIEAARQIAQISPTTSILMCTIWCSRQLIELARDAGIAGTLSKGDLNRIIPCIETILQREPPCSAALS
jgi:two-component system, NarL family, response regulator LiaR